MDGQTIKVGIYTAGASIRIIGEHDLTIQNYGHRDVAIYLVEVAMLRNPDEEITEDEINRYIKSMVENFKQNRFCFKAKDRADADLFIKSKLSDKWKTVRELSEV